MQGTRLTCVALLGVLARPAAAFAPPGGLVLKHSFVAQPAGPGRLACRSLPRALPVPQRRGALGCHGTVAAEADDANKLPAYSKFGQLELKGKTLNLPIGLLFLVGSAVWAVFLFPFVLISYAFSKVFDDLRRESVDFMVAVWAKGALFSLNCWPTLTGAENLPDKNEPVMYIPNHCSYLDIFTLSGTVPRPFKYMSKQEILEIPIIGWAMQMAGHIGIKRMDKRSQLEAFKAAVEALNKGNSVVTFAEGTRSPDGRLQTMKAGPIKMAMKSGVKVVPVSICNLYKWMPSSAVSPLAFPKQVEVKIHPAIDTKGKTEQELLDYVFNCVNDGLPDHQKSLKGNNP
jgi:1-acyl-sn-glycerol-3-phosphate acyltransferase